MSNTAFVNSEASRRSGERIRFSFGRNWRSFLKEINPQRMEMALRSLREITGKDDLSGERFIDVGSGSGVFSLCALRLGALAVTSIDIDPHSIACTRTLYARSGRPSHWRILRGSALNRDFINQVGQGSIVYSWGVLHHTGAMWEAIENAMRLVAPAGVLCLALYNYPNNPARHMQLKRFYNRLPEPLQPALAAAYAAARLRTVTFSQHRNPFTYVRDYPKHSRGMSFWRDVVDWLGGLPCEFASEDEVQQFAARHGFRLEHVVVGTPGANNEYRLRRVD